MPRLLQQLFRKQVTGCLSLTDKTGDLSEVYLRSGYPVHVYRPVDSDRLDRVLIENGVVSERAVEMAGPLVADGMRLGEALERLGALTRQALADVLKAQMRRKLTRLFCIHEGSYQVFVEHHAYGEGDDLAAMRVDPRTLYFPAIRMAYDMARLNRELARLHHQQFRLRSFSPGAMAAMQIPGDDLIVEAVRTGWQTLESIDPLSSRPLEARAVLLALYYGDMLERQKLMESSDQTAVVASSTEKPTHVVWPSGEMLEATAELVEGESTIAEPIAAEDTIAEPIVLPAKPEPPAVRKTGSSIPAVPAVDQALRSSLVDLGQKLDKLSYFELLEVPESASASEISDAFFRAARRYHPDRLAGAGLSEMVQQAERILARMSEAAMTLSDPGKRAAYLAERSGKKKAPESTIPSVVEAETLFLKGEAFLKKGDYSAAIDCFTAACRANPNEPQFRAYLAWARFENPKARKESVVREVQRILNEAVTAQPKFARGHYWQGLIYKFLNEPDRAERCFRQAAEQDGDFIEATRELRLCEMRRQRGGSKSGESPRAGLMNRLFKK